MSERARKGATPPSSPPAALQNRNGSASDDERLRMREDVERADAARRIAEAELKRLRAEGEAAKFSPSPSNGEVDPIDMAIARLVKLKSLQALEAPQRPHNGDDGLEKTLRLVAVVKQLFGGDGSSATEILKAVLPGILSRDEVSLLEKY